MINITDKSNCCGCHSCFNACPCDAITMREDSEGFLYPHVDQEKCIDCRLCENVCPELSPQEISDVDTKVYACYRSDIKKRLQSQSGGIFALLAEYTLDHDGVVFGAAFDDTWTLIHRSVDNQKDLLNLLGSKYVQSKIGYAYCCAEDYLKQGNRVLFSGTPCQIQGLKKYLQEPYENLITVDLICHGVPSPKVWKKYLNEFSRGDRLIDFVQKDKKKKNASVYTFQNKGELVSEYDKNPYIKGFNQNLYLRPSCHECSFKGVERCSDLTLGDFWGLENYHPEFVDAYGISAVIIHTPKGKKAFEGIKQDCVYIECDTEMLIPGNPCLITSSPLTDKRKAFFDNWNNKGIITTIQLLTKTTIFHKIHKLINPLKWYAVAVVNRVRKKS